MRFVVFGGGGDMGRRAVLELAVTPGVERIALVGRSMPALEQAREQALAAQEQARARWEHAGGGTEGNSASTDAAAAVDEPTRAGAQSAVAVPEATSKGGFAELVLLQQDIQDTAAVERIMGEYDVAVGAAGPFYLLEELLVKAAIASGTAYVSVCDDGDATEAALAHDEAARQAGVTVLTGLGWTPGLTNLLAMRNAALLDNVTDVRMYWAGSASEADNGTAVVFHTMHILHGDVVTFADGRSTMVRAGSGAETVRFPEPLGAVKVCHVGHPEPITLPDYIPGVRTVALKGGIVEPALHMMAGITGRLRLAGTHGRRKFWASMLKPSIPLLSKLGPRKPRLSGVVVEVEGRAKGTDKSLTVRSAAVAPMNALTSIPAAVGALWIAQGRIDRKGVFPPEAEGGPDPELFLRAVAERGIEIEHTMA